MKYFTLFILSLIPLFSLSQTKGWKYYSVSKDFKLKLPSEPERRIVRDLEVFSIEDNNYDWKIIVLPLSSFLKDDTTVNFLGKVKNMSNTIQADPYLTLLRDSIFSLNGNRAYFSESKNLNVSDTSQSTTSFQFFIQIENRVYISNLKSYKESSLKIKDFKSYFSSFKIDDAELTDSLTIIGEETYFLSPNKKRFLKQVYCDLPEIEKTKSYHKLLSIRVNFYLTETGKVSAVSLENSKMILITRETESKLKAYFKKFSFKVVEKEKPSSTMRYSFVLYLTDFARKLFCK